MRSENFEETNQQKHKTMRLVRLGRQMSVVTPRSEGGRAPGRSSWSRFESRRRPKTCVWGAARPAGARVGDAPHASVRRFMTRGGIFERRRALDFDSQTIVRAVAVANVGGAAEKVMNE